LFLDPPPLWKWPHPEKCNTTKEESSVTATDI